jgi:uncharacterized membrane protein
MITKKQLGLGLSILGATIAIAVLAVDWIGAGQFIGLGPIQKIGLAIGLLLFLVGLSLLPLGDKAA